MDTQRKDKSTKEKELENKQKELKKAKETELENDKLYKKEVARISRLEIAQGNLQTEINNCNAEIIRCEEDISNSKVKEALDNKRNEFYENEEKATQGAYKISGADQPSDPSASLANESLDESLQSLGKLSLYQLENLRPTLSAHIREKTAEKKVAEQEWIRYAKEIKSAIQDKYKAAKANLLILKKIYVNKIHELTSNRTRVTSKLESDRESAYQNRDPLTIKLAKKRAEVQKRQETSTTTEPDASKASSTPPTPVSETAALEAQVATETKKIEEIEELILKTDQFFSQITHILKSSIGDIENQKIPDEFVFEDRELARKIALPEWSDAVGRQTFAMIERTTIYGFRSTIHTETLTAINWLKNLHALNAFFEPRFKDAFIEVDKTVDLDKTLEQFKDYEALLNECALEQVKARYSPLKKAQHAYLEKARLEKYFQEESKRVEEVYRKRLEQHNVYKENKRKLSEELRQKEAAYKAKENSLISAMGTRDAKLSEKDKNQEEINNSKKTQDRIKEALTQNRNDKHGFEAEKAAIERAIEDVEKKILELEAKEAKDRAKVHALEGTLKDLEQLIILNKQYKDAFDAYTMAENAFNAAKSKLTKNTEDAEKKLPGVRDTQTDKRKELEAKKRETTKATRDIAKKALHLAQAMIFFRTLDKCKATDTLFRRKNGNPSQTTTEKFKVHKAISHVIEAKIQFANLKRTIALKEALSAHTNPQIPNTVELKYALAVHQQKKHELDQHWRVSNPEDKPKLRKAMLELVEKEQQLLDDFFISKVLRGPVKEQTAQTLNEKCAVKLVVGMVEIILNKMLVERTRTKGERPYNYNAIINFKKYLIENKATKKSIQTNLRFKINKMHETINKLINIKKLNTEILEQKFSDLKNQLANIPEIKEALATNNHSELIIRLRRMEEETNALAEQYKDFVNNLKIRQEDENLLAKFEDFKNQLKHLQELKTDIEANNHLQVIARLKRMGEEKRDLWMKYEDLSKKLIQSKNDEYKFTIENPIKLLEKLNSLSDFNEPGKKEEYLKLIDIIGSQKELDCETLFKEHDQLKDDLEKTIAFNQNLVEPIYDGLITDLDYHLSQEQSPRVPLHKFTSSLETEVQKKNYVNVLRVHSIKAKLALLQQYSDKPYIEDYENRLSEFEKKKQKYRTEKYDLKVDVETAEIASTEKTIAEKKLTSKSETKKEFRWTKIAEKVSYYLPAAIMLLVQLSETLKQFPKNKGHLSFRAGLIIWGITTGVHICLQTTFPKAHSLFKKAVAQ
ncbi:MAG: hypothetical protein JSS10_01610 [Verrucomicrobia bacterium]|nr:hypothetical protein [Verrucomicrobiota bacterium]